MTINGQRTVYGIHIDLNRAIGKEYTPLANTTLNEKFGILNGISVDDSLFPTLGYYAIGVGGYDIINGNNGYSYSKHSPVDAALFQHIPFIMRPITADLSLDEREEYRFRKLEVIDGIEYASYYLKKIPLIELRDYFYNITTVNNETVLGIYNTNTDKLLNPEPSTRSINTINISESNYVTCIAKLKFTLTLEELVELENVLKLKNLIGRKITEIGLVYGIDMVQEDSSKEVAYAQISHHVEILLDTAIHLETTKPVIRSIEIGGTEPLLV